MTRPGRTLLGGALVAIGSLLVASVLVVRLLVDPGSYTGALDAADAYDRLYTEVLADPELAALADDLAGGLGRVGEVAAPQVRALTAATLRLTLPPDVLRAATEAAVGAVLAYVRGDTGTLELDVDVDGILERVGRTAAVDTRARLAGTADRQVASAGEFEAAAADLVAGLRAGVVPGSLVVPDDGIDPDAVVDAILAPLDGLVDGEVAARVRALVVVGEGREALVAAASTAVLEPAARVAVELRTALEEGRRLDLVGELADRAATSRAAVVDRLDGVRAAVRWTVPLGLAGAALVVVGTATVLLTHRRDLRRSAAVLGVASVAAGLLFGGAWGLGRAVVDPPLAPATGTGPGTWSLPAGVRSVLADIEAELARQLDGAALRAGLLLGLAGLGLVGAAAWAGRSRSRSQPAGPSRPPPARSADARLRPARSTDDATAASPVGAGIGAVGVRAVAALTAAVAGVVGVVAVLEARPGRAARACNGSVTLCERPYDRVVQAATHNSMSSPDVVDVWPEHDVDLRGQLDSGVRTLLIDTYPWPPLTSPEQLTAPGEVLTAAQAQAVVASLVASLPAEVRSRAAGREGTFLCHIHCVFGGQPLVEALAQIGRFLDDNPREVVTLIIQDAISPAETAEAFARAGLDDHLHVHPAGRPWATLGQLIERDERLVVFAENEGPPPRWYHRAFEHMEETPFLFLDPSQFSCAPNRGDPGAGLFLMNHWVQRIAASRVDAAVVNRRPVLVERALRCREERGLMPTYLAVNFSTIGELDQAVDELNALLDTEHR